MKSAWEAIKDYNKDHIFVSFLENVQLSKKERNRLAIDRLVGYVDEFCERAGKHRIGSNLRKLKYIRDVATYCSRKGIVSRACQEEFMPVIEGTLEDMESGRLTPTEVAEVLRRDILESKKLAGYSASNRY